MKKPLSLFLLLSFVPLVHAKKVTRSGRVAAACQHHAKYDPNPKVRAYAALVEHAIETKCQRTSRSIAETGEMGWTWAEDKCEAFLAQVGEVLGYDETMMIQMESTGNPGDAILS